MLGVILQAESLPQAIVKRNYNVGLKYKVSG